MPNVVGEGVAVGGSAYRKEHGAMEALVTISGNVGGSVEFKPTRNNSSLASFRVGCTPRINRQGSWSDGTTLWMTIVCYRTLADHVLSSIGKGDPVLVQGKLRRQAWIGADGQRHERTVIEATSVGHDLTRGTSVFERVQRMDIPEDLDREAGELIARIEAEGPDDSADDDQFMAGVSN